MIINSVHKINNYVNFNKQNKHPVLILKNDTFERTTPVFKGNKNENAYSFQNFKRWSEENDFLSQANEIVEKTGKILGSGFEGTTFEIPNCDKWIIKEYKRSHLLPVKTEKANVEEFENILPDINAGQCVALVNIPCGRNTTRYYILQRQSGEAMGIKYTHTNDIDEYTIKQHINMLKTLVNAPDKTFDRLLNDIEYVHSKGYELDVQNPQNFLFDEKEQVIKFVDINDKYRGSGTQYGEVLFAMLDSYFSLNLVKSEKFADKKDEISDLSDKVIKKYFKAMQKKGVKLTEGKTFNELIESPILNNVLDAKDKNEKVKKLKSLNLME